MAIQMRRGPLADYDASRMLAGEWGITTDAESGNQKVFISFAPGTRKEVMMVEDAQAQIAVAAAEAVDEATAEAEAWAHGNSFTVNDYASGDGSTTAFTLAETPSSIQGVYVDGSAVTTYTISGNVITFTTAPGSGENNIRVSYTVSTATDNAKYYKDQASASATSAASSATSASTSATSASSSASTASTKASQAASSALSAESSVTLAQSYAKGGTGTRSGEDTDNAKYYKEQAEETVELMSVKALWVNMGTISSLPVTKTVSGCQTDMVVARVELGTPTAQTADWTFNTSTAGKLTISGSISGSTTCKVLLVQEVEVTAT